jgi:sacsin
LTKNEIPAKSLWSEFKAILRTERPQSEQKIDQEWYIVNLFQGKNEMSEDMAKIAHDEQLSYAPYVGVAFPLTHRHRLNFKGHVFCFLPLPVEPDGKSLTNLPVHVNGFFALTSNRRHMLWATQDQHEADDDRLVWNKLMISEVLSLAYTRLVDSLLQDPDISPEMVYQCLPDAENVDLKWSILLQSLYTKVFGLKMFWTGDMETPTRRKLGFAESLFFIFDSNEKVLSRTTEALWRMLTVYTENVVRLPNHLKFAVCCDEFIPSRVKACTISADLICHFLIKNPSYKSFERSLKLDILHYLLENTTVDGLEDIELVPTDDVENFVSFKNAREKVYICSNGEEKMFPLMEKHLLSSIPEDIIDNLLNVAESG